jgi:acetyl-CoA acetyltransferase
VRGVEALGLAAAGEGGAWVEAAYERAFGGDPPPLLLPPVNTHGGLLGFGAPWEAPAMHGIVEAVAQLRGGCGARQVAGAKRAVCYGNGGVFSAAAVAVIEVVDGDGGGTTGALSSRL